MKCPKCSGEMYAVTYEEVDVDRCVSCGGLFFDILEQEDLRAKPGSEAIDIGDPEAGRRNDAIDRIACPRDGARMLRVVDASQPHIWLETCPGCNGTFFDAGEFRDFKERTLSEYLLRRARPRP